MLPVPPLRSSRRTLLATAVLLPLAACTAPGDGRPAPGGSSDSEEADVQPERITYGPEPDQFGELARPVGASRGTVVVVHGGFWQDAYGLEYGRPLAEDLAARRWTVWNVEYRRLGSGGGWPNTFTDVAAAIDHLAELDVDTDSVVALGHSAGGHLAVWAAGRADLPTDAPGADPRVEMSAVVSQAGVLSLAEAAENGVGGSAAADLMGGTPTEVPDRYRLADPLQAVPLSARVVCLHSATDGLVPIEQSRRYVDVAREAGADARLVEVEGDHFALIDPTSPAWSQGEYVEVAMTGQPT